MAPWIAPANHSASPRRGITRFTNCRLITSGGIVSQDLYVSSITGKIISPQNLFFTEHYVADATIDLQNRLVAPGFIDVQLNGAFGFDFSDIPTDMTSYIKSLRTVNKQLIQTGVTSYLPTLTSQRPEVYHAALPFLKPSGRWRDAEDGAESLGAHCEGPFMAPEKKGCHPEQVLQRAELGFADLERVYGAKNLHASRPHPHPTVDDERAITMITAAPELARMMDAIPALAARGIVTSIGHTAADYDAAAHAVAAGATMITHLFNAMPPLNHRQPNVFGVLSHAAPRARPFFGVIADGIHLHPTAVTLAYAAHPAGFILVTDAMALTGLPDGVHAWTNGSRIVKRGRLLTLHGSDTIAGAVITLLECVVNFWNWSGVPLADAVRAVTETPARMLGVSETKGSLAPGADADLVVLEEVEGAEGGRDLRLEQVWKFGACVFDRTE